MFSTIVFHRCGADLIPWGCSHRIGRGATQSIGPQIGLADCVNEPAYTLRVLVQWEPYVEQVSRVSFSSGLVVFHGLLQPIACCLVGWEPVFSDVALSGQFWSVSAFSSLCSCSLPLLPACLCPCLPPFCLCWSFSVRPLLLLPDSAPFWTAGGP